MADAADLKSVVRKDVRVRLPPSAPLSTVLATTTCIVPRSDIISASRGEMSER